MQSHDNFPNPDASREKDKLRIKELESEIRVLQVHLAKLIERYHSS